MIVHIGEKQKAKSKGIEDMEQSFAETVKEVLEREAEITLKQSGQVTEMQTDADPLTTCLALMAGAAGVFRAMLNEEDEKDRAGIKDGMGSLFGAFIDGSLTSTKVGRREK